MEGQNNKNKKLKLHNIESQHWVQKEWTCYSINN